VTLNHGSGGRLTYELITERFIPSFNNDIIKKLTDAAILQIGNSILAFTTDSYVVKPIFFPGGDIGKLAICGTINDLAVMGAKPVAVSCALILEEGLELSLLDRVISSVSKTARDSGVAVVTGDTKVVEKGGADKLFINASGIGIVQEGVMLSMERIEPGDKVIVSGSVGEHGIAVLSVRAGISFESEIKSDCAPLYDMVEFLLNTSGGIKFMRDPTRGGLATVLCEVALQTGLCVYIDERKIPVSDPVKSACALLGFDPLYIANEGKIVAFVPDKDAEKIRDAMRQHPLGKSAEIIGEVRTSPREMVLLRTQIGGERVVEMLTGEQLPRIC
jgi:hydrogenase expression/formation protein HypE